MFDKEQRAREGSQVWTSPPAIPSPPWFRFRSQLYFINHIRSEIDDPKQGNTACSILEMNTDCYVNRNSSNHLYCWRSNILLQIWTHWFSPIPRLRIGC